MGPEGGQVEQHAEFEQFVAAQYAALARTALLLTGSRASGEDLLQEALLKTYVAWLPGRRWGRWSGYGSCGA